MMITMGIAFMENSNCGLYLTMPVASSEVLGFLSLLSKNPILQFTVTLYLF
jgi:hypothetical protein